MNIFEKTIMDLIMKNFNSSIMGSYSNKPHLSSIYWTDLVKIKFTSELSKINIDLERLKDEVVYYRKYGRFKTEIVLDKNFYLHHGYYSIKIAEAVGIKRVPIRFIN